MEKVTVGALFSAAMELRGKRALALGRGQPTGEFIVASTKLEEFFKKCEVEIELPAEIQNSIIPLLTRLT